MFISANTHLGHRSTYSITSSLLLCFLFYLFSFFYILGCDAITTHNVECYIICSYSKKFLKGVTFDISPQVFWTFNEYGNPKCNILDWNCFVVYLIHIAQNCGVMFMRKQRHQLLLDCCLGHRHIARSLLFFHKRMFGPLTRRSTCIFQMSFKGKQHCSTKY